MQPIDVQNAAFFKTWERLKLYPMRPTIPKNKLTKLIYGYDVCLLHGWPSLLIAP